MGNQDSSIEIAPASASSPPSGTISRGNMLIARSPETMKSHGAGHARQMDGWDGWDGWDDSSRIVVLPLGPIGGLIFAESGPGVPSCV